MHLKVEELYIWRKVGVYSNLKRKKIFKFHYSSIENNKILRNNFNQEGNQEGKRLVQ